MKNKKDETESLEDSEMKIAEEIAAAHEIAKKVFGASASPHAAFRIHDIINAVEVNGAELQEELLTAAAAAKETFGVAAVDADDEVVFEQYLRMFSVDMDGDEDEGEEDDDNE